MRRREIRKTKEDNEWKQKLYKKINEITNRECISVCVWVSGSRTKQIDVMNDICIFKDSKPCQGLWMIHKKCKCECVKCEIIGRATLVKIDCIIVCRTYYNPDIFNTLSNMFVCLLGIKDILDEKMMVKVMIDYAWDVEK